MALTIPEVTVPVNPSGEPKATVKSPTLIAFESPILTGFKPVASIFNTAKS